MAKHLIIYLFLLALNIWNNYLKKKPEQICIDQYSKPHNRMQMSMKISYFMVNIVKLVKSRPPVIDNIFNLHFMKNKCFTLIQMLFLTKASVVLGNDLTPNKWLQRVMRGDMMTSSNGNTSRVTGPLWGESIGHRWIPLTKASDAENVHILVFSLIWACTNGKTNNRDVGDLRRHHANYDVTEMVQI